MSRDENLWYVKTADGDVHRVTLDQLDEAFQAGRINGRVMVLPPGATKWQTLAELAGLDEAPPAASSAATLPTSLRPVSVDLSIDLDDNAFRKKSPKRLLVGGAVAALALCGAIVALSRGHDGDSAAVAVAAAAPPPASVAPPASAPDPVASAAPAPSAALQLTDDQKAKLAAADQALKAKTRKKSHAGAGHHHSSSPKYKSQGFTTGGNKYDPLNSSL